MYIWVSGAGATVFSILHGWIFFSEKWKQIRFNTAAAVSSVQLLMCYAKTMVLQGELIVNFCHFATNEFAAFFVASSQRQKRQIWPWDSPTPVVSPNTALHISGKIGENCTVWKRHWGSVCRPLAQFVLPNGLSLVRLKWHQAALQASLLSTCEPLTAFSFYLHKDSDPNESFSAFQNDIGHVWWTSPRHHLRKDLRLFWPTYCSRTWLILIGTNQTQREKTSPQCKQTCIIRETAQLLEGDCGKNRYEISGATKRTTLHAGDRTSA